MDKQMTLFNSNSKNKNNKKSTNKKATKIGMTEQKATKPVSPEYAKECDFYNQLRAKKLNYRLHIFPSSICHSIYLFYATSNDFVGEQCEKFCKYDHKIKPNHFYYLDHSKDLSKMLRPTQLDLKQMQSLYQNVTEDSSSDSDDSGKASDK